MGPDGKLTQAEKDRRKKFNLCSFCGGKHKFENCDKRNPPRSTNSPRDTRGRAAATSPDQVEGEEIQEIVSPEVSDAPEVSEN